MDFERGVERNEPHILAVVEPCDGKQKVKPTIYILRSDLEEFLCTLQGASGRGMLIMSVAIERCHPCSKAKWKVFVE